MNDDNYDWYHHILGIVFFEKLLLQVRLGDVGGRPSVRGYNPYLI